MIMWFFTVCLSGVAKLVRAQLGEINAVRASAVPARRKHGGSFRSIFTERGASAVENLGSLCYWERQFFHSKTLRYFLRSVHRNNRKKMSPTSMLFTSLFLIASTSATYGSSHKSPAYLLSKLNIVNSTGDWPTDAACIPTNSRYTYF